MERSHEYEIIRLDTDAVVGRIWWDGKDVKYSNDKVKVYISSLDINEKTPDDGVEFLSALPGYLSGKYMRAKKVS